MATVLHLAYQFFSFFPSILYSCFYVCKAELLKLKTSHILEQSKSSNRINMSITVTSSLNRFILNSNSCHWPIPSLLLLFRLYFAHFGSAVCTFRVGWLLFHLMQQEHWLSTV